MVCKESFLIVKVYLENVFITFLSLSLCQDGPPALLCISAVFSLSHHWHDCVVCFVCMFLSMPYLTTGWDPSGISAPLQCTPEAINTTCWSSAGFWEQTFSLRLGVELTVVAKAVCFPGVVLLCTEALKFISGRGKLCARDVWRRICSCVKHDRKHWISPPDLEMVLLCFCNFKTLWCQKSKRRISKLSLK